MDLTPAQRKAAFAVIVVALLGLGAFLLVPGAFGRHQQTQAGQPVAATSSSPAPRSAPAISPSPAQPAAVPTLSPGAGVNIYQWLPFSQTGLAAAAAVVRQFGAGYVTYTYTENAAEYVGRMRDLVTSGLAATLARGFSTPGVVQQRKQDKQSSSGTARITALRGFGPASLTFLVAVSQRLTTTRGTTHQGGNYAVTVTGAGTHWQVNDIELATAGNS